MKTFGKSIGLFVAIQWLALFPNLVADCCANGSLDLVGGWRRGEFTRFVSSANNIGTDDLIKAKGLNIWQIGLEGYITPNFNSCDTWMDQFFAKGHANLGWVTSGRYRRHIQKYNAPQNECFGCITGPGGQVLIPCLPNPLQSGISISRAGTQTNEGRARKGSLWDYSIGLGYSLDLYDCFSVGPILGYSFHKLHFKSTKVISDVSADNFDEDMRYRSKFQGPWIGLDAYYSWCNFLFSFSYEYHWSRWRGTFDLDFEDQGDCLNFSRLENAQCGRGNVFKIKGDYIFCHHVSLGLELQFERFRAKRGTSRPSAGNGNFNQRTIGCRFDQFDIMKHATWSSVSIAARLGYQF